MKNENTSTNRKNNNAVEYKESHWKDTGCKYSPSCFTCPLPECRYVKWYYPKEGESYQAVRALIQLGYDNAAIMEKSGLGKSAIKKYRTRYNRETIR